MNTPLIAAGAKGIDVSKWQGDIDWSLVQADGVEYAFIKATEGAGYRDPQFRANMGNAHRNAPAVFLGAYHFARVSRTPEIGYELDAQAEALEFCEEINLYKSCWTLPPMLDLEWDKRTTAIPSADIVRWARVFLDTVEQQLSTQCGVYTQASFWKYKLAKSMALAKHPLWLAGKTQIPGWPAMINQYSASGTVRGIKGKVDMNRWTATNAIAIRNPSMMTALLTNMLARVAGVPRRSDT